MEGEVGYIQRLYGIFISSREKTGQVWWEEHKESSGKYKVSLGQEEDPSSSESNFQKLELKSLRNKWYVNPDASVQDVC